MKNNTLKNGIQIFITTMVFYRIYYWYCPYYNPRKIKIRQQDFLKLIVESLQIIYRTRIFVLRDKAYNRQLRKAMYY